MELYKRTQKTLVYHGAVDRPWMNTKSVKCLTFFHVQAYWFYALKNLHTAKKIQNIFNFPYRQCFNLCHSG